MQPRAEPQERRCEGPGSSTDVRVDTRYHAPEDLKILHGGVAAPRISQGCQSVTVSRYMVAESCTPCNCAIGKYDFANPNFCVNGKIELSRWSDAVGGL